MVLILKSMLHEQDRSCDVRETSSKQNSTVLFHFAKTHPMVVIKLVVKEPSEKRRRRQLLPTPAKVNNRGGLW